MATKKKKVGRTGDADVKSQHPDTKGTNVKRDANRATGQGAITFTRGQGTAGFRKRQKGGD
jgi:hypothetical protein